MKTNSGIIKNFGKLKKVGPIIIVISLSTKFHITKLIVEVEYVIELSYMNV